MSIENNEYDGLLQRYMYDLQWVLQIREFFLIWLKISKIDQKFREKNLKLSTFLQENSPTSINFSQIDSFPLIWGSYNQKVSFLPVEILKSPLFSPPYLVKMANRRIPKFPLLDPFPQKMSCPL